MSNKILTKMHNNFEHKIKEYHTLEARSDIQPTAEKTACFAKFKIKNNALEEKTNLCLLPGIARQVSTLERLGIHTDAIAEQCNTVELDGYDNWEWLDFLKVVRGVRCQLDRIVIQNCTGDPSIFDEGIILGRTIHAYESAVRRIDLNPYVDVKAFDRTKVTILFDEATPLDAITYLALTLPPQAVIIITFLFYVP